jgi:hypothetical protein
MAANFAKAPLLLTLIVAIWTVAFGVAGAQQPQRSLREITTLQSPALADGHDALLLAFDLMPDSSRLAVLYSPADKLGDSPAPFYGELWVAIWDFSANKVVTRAKLSEVEVQMDVFQVGPVAIQFTSDMQALAVLGLKKVWILNGATLSVVRSLPAPTPDAIPLQILFPSQGYAAISYQQDRGQFYTSIIETASWKEVRHWQSTSMPQTFSSDLKLAAMPDITNNAGGVSNVCILDGDSGARIRSIPVGFAFPKTWTSKRDAGGKVKVRFIEGEQLAVLPDETRDSSGHVSGQSIELIDARSGNLTKQISLTDFAPSQFVVESQDRKWLERVS